MYSNDELQQLTEKWSADRKITTNGKVPTQFMKLAEEFGELGNALAKDKLPEAKDAIGDMIVVLTNISVLLGTNINECWNGAYDEIKDRTGTLLPNGNFVKDES